MELYLNGEKRQVAANTTLPMLISALGLEGQRYAVEVNRAIVPKSVIAEHTLHEGDRIEIIQAMGGG
jgi:sulfur carrier protein